MAEHFRLGERLETIMVPDRYGGLEIGDQTAYDAARDVFESHRRDLEAEMARRLRRWF
jgi:hypothetical protein